MRSRSVESLRNSVIEMPMAPTRLVRPLLLLIALALGIVSTSAAIACAAMDEHSAVAVVPNDHCGADGDGSPDDAGQNAPCALACPAGCLLVLPVVVGADVPPFGAAFDTDPSSSRLAGLVFGPEPPRPRASATT